MLTDARAHNTRNLKKTRKNIVQQDQPREHKGDNEGNLEGNLENGDKTRDNQRNREIAKTQHEKTTENE